MPSRPHDYSSTSPPPLPPPPEAAHGEIHALRLTEPVRVEVEDALTQVAPSPRENFLVFGKPVLGAEELDEVAAVLAGGWLGTGPRVAAFERAFAAYKGVAGECAVAVNSCTAALHLALKLAGIGPGDEVITTPLTFCATVHAILNCGATPVLADVEVATRNLDPAAVEAAITPRTAAILPVHFAGRACDMTRLVALAERHGLELIEDCAHAIETTHAGRPAGTLGRFGAFSFYATKNLTTGEGGMLLCRDAKDAQRARTLALHGLSRDAYDRFQSPSASHPASAQAPRFRHYQVVEPGFKYNMTDLAAALGLHQLAKVEAHWWRRLHAWRRYDAALSSDLPITLPALPRSGADHDERHALHLYSVLVDDAARRDGLLDRMIERRIGVGVHYLALPDHAWYQRELGWRPEAVPVATDIGRRTVSLPLTAGLCDRDIDDVVAALRGGLR